MTDREKVIKGLEVCSSIAEGESCPKDCPYYQDVCYGYDQLMRDALAMLQEQEEREKAICKGICEFIRGSCSTDTDSDKEYVCHVVQQMFIKGWR